jgi:glucose-1-phosphate adenylyltransferase
MDLISVHPVFNLYNPEWPTFTGMNSQPPAKFVFDDSERRGVALDSMIAAGVIVSGGTVRRSVLSPGVSVHSRAVVEDSVLLDGVDVGRDAVVRRAIIDKGVKVPRGVRIGVSAVEDRARGFTLSDNGIVVVGKGEVIPS